MRERKDVPVAYYSDIVLFTCHVQWLGSGAWVFRNGKELEVIECIDTIE